MHALTDCNARQSLPGGIDNAERYFDQWGWDFVQKSRNAFRREQWQSLAQFRAIQHFGNFQEDGLTDA